MSYLPNHVDRQTTNGPMMRFPGNFNSTCKSSVANQYMWPADMMNYTTSLTANSTNQFPMGQQPLTTLPPLPALPEHFQQIPSNGSHLLPNTQQLPHSKVNPCHATTNNLDPSSIYTKLMTGDTSRPPPSSAPPQLTLPPLFNPEKTILPVSSSAIRTAGKEKKDARGLVKTEGTSSQKSRKQSGFLGGTDEVDDPELGRVVLAEIKGVYKNCRGIWAAQWTDERGQRHTKYFNPKYYKSEEEARVKAYCFKVKIQREVETRGGVCNGRRRGRKARQKVINDARPVSKNTDVGINKDFNLELLRRQNPFTGQPWDYPRIVPYVQATLASMGYCYCESCARTTMAFCEQAAAALCVTPGLMEYYFPGPAAFPPGLDGYSLPRTDAAPSHGEPPSQLQFYSPPLEPVTPAFDFHNMGEDEGSKYLCTASSEDSIETASTTVPTPEIPPLDPLPGLFPAAMPGAMPVFQRDIGWGDMEWPSIEDKPLDEWTDYCWTDFSRKRPMSHSPEDGASEVKRLRMERQNHLRPFFPQGTVPC